MFCQKCGAAGKEDNKFCHACGNKMHTEEKNQVVIDEKQLRDVEEQVLSVVKEEEQVKEKISLKKVATPIVIASLLVVGFVFGLIFGMQDRGGGGVSEVGFDTPEEAMIFYLEGLRESDLNRMLSAFATETFVENIDFETLMWISTSYNFLWDGIMPSANDFAVSINLGNRIGMIGSHIITQYFTLAQIEFDHSRPHRVVTDMADTETASEEAAAFVNQFKVDLDSPDLQALEIIGFIPPEALNEDYLSERVQEFLELQAEANGVDEIANRVIAFQLGEDLFMLVAAVGNYDGKWRLIHFGGVVAGLISMPSHTMGMLGPEDIDWMFHNIDSLEDLIVPIK
jgi:hypothetical protein